MNKIYHGFSHCSGVYKITNIENGDVYFGQAAQLGTRAQQHEGNLVAGAEGRVNEKGKLIKHPNRYLQAAWTKYKSDAFEFEVIAVYPDKTERTAAEQALIDKHYGPGCYNIATDATVNGMSGRKHSPEACAAMSAFHKGRKHSPEHIAKRKAANTGKKRSPEACATMSAGQTGKKHSAEHIAKRKAANTGKKRSPEQCATNSASKTGKKHSPETCEKLRAAQTGKKLSPDHCAAIRAASKAVWVKRRAAKALLVDNLDEQ